MRVQLTLFDVGHCRHCERVTLAGGRWASVTFPSMVALIVHPTEGAILYDTGYAPHFIGATAAFPERAYRWATPAALPQAQRLEVQLAACGLRPSDIRWCLVSHFHADHIAGLRDLPSARFMCMREDLEGMRAMSRLRGLRNGWLPALVPDDFDARVRYAGDGIARALPAPWTTLGEGVDLFGDGSLFAVAMPGHAPRQMGLCLRDAQDRAVLLCADACWSHLTFRERRLPTWPARLVTHDWAAYVRTVERLHALARTAPDVAILPSHCRASLDAYRAATSATMPGGRACASS
ncbi:MBL fold metallo-hydrolase [Luteimonas deserti]|uniref:MBL fold metallo-hydrolase n=1 Tax=Luteimonas deserti TaxID=2752306 RepID=UPI002E2A1143|nr:MBL fold metallo-hydrolase [Luteimonas deserti]